MTLQHQANLFTCFQTTFARGKDPLVKVVWLHETMSHSLLTAPWGAQHCCSYTNEMHCSDLEQESWSMKHRKPLHYKQNRTVVRKSTVIRSQTALHVHTHTRVAEWSPFILLPPGITIHRFIFVHSSWPSRTPHSVPTRLSLSFALSPVGVWGVVAYITNGSLELALVFDANLRGHCYYLLSQSLRGATRTASALTTKVWHEPHTARGQRREVIRKDTSKYGMPTSDPLRAKLALR